MTDTVRVVSVGGGEGSAQPRAVQGGPNLGESQAEGAQIEDGPGRAVFTPQCGFGGSVVVNVSPSHPHPTLCTESPTSSETSPESPVRLLPGLSTSCRYSSYIIFIIFAFLFHLISFSPYTFHHLFSIFLLLFMIRNQNQTQQNTVSS